VKRLGFFALVALVVAASSPPARAIPFDATLGLFLEGALAPVDFRPRTGEASAGPNGTLQLSARPSFSPQSTYLFGPGFHVYLVALPNAKQRGLTGTLAPSQGPGGGFGGRARLRNLLSQGFLSSHLYTSVCFGLGRIGEPDDDFQCGRGTLIDVTGWTTGNITLTGMDGVLRAQGSDARTPGGRGHILLVSPIRIEGGLHPSPLVGFGTLTLSLVPEPGTLALTAFGALGLAALGRQRRLVRRS
jgi:PEP-CTERM motif-containing protein